MMYPPKDSHPSSWARRALTSFMRRTPLTTALRCHALCMLSNVYAAASPQHDNFEEDSDAEAGTGAQWLFGRRSAGQSRHTPRTYGSAGQSAASNQSNEAARPSADAGEPSLDVHVSARRHHRGRRVLTSQTQPDVEDV